MKKWFSNCFPLVYICLHCDEGCIFWHFGAPGTPGFYVRAQHDPEKNLIKLFYFFHIFYFNSKGSYQIASIFDMQIIIKWRVYVNQDGPSLIIEVSPPPPPPPGPPFSQIC